MIEKIFPYGYVRLIFRTFHISKLIHEIIRIIPCLRIYDYNLLCTIKGREGDETGSL